MNHTWYIKNIEYSRIPYFSAVVIDLIPNKSLTCYSADGSSWLSLCDEKTKDQFQLDYWGRCTFAQDWIQTTEEDAKSILEKIIEYRKHLYKKVKNESNRCRC